ncbi:MAG TPA: NADH:flavin oxidoreductase [Acidimicrobiia bacterium]|nr:NADH:flavin oxidoreductase [Acidimicrobiia bacterium]
MNGSGGQERERLFSPAALGPLTLRNRIVKSATNEGMTRDGLVTDDLIAFHRRFAAGGVGMTTVAYCAVSGDGRTFRHQLWMRPETVPGLARLTDAVHEEGAAASLQIGHSGYFATPHAIGGRPVGPSKVFNPAGLAFSRPATDGDLDRLADDFARAAELAGEAAFDAVEVHVGHGYLLSQFLTPFTNRRKDEWGGSIENRARFPREVLRRVRQAAPASMAVTAKLNMSDGFRRGLTLEDGVTVARMIESDGSVDALELTGGFTSRTPMYLMRGEVPLRELIENERGVVRRLGLRLTSFYFLKAWPFEEAFFLPQALEVRAAVDLPLILLGGLTRLDTMERAMAEGFEFVAMARALLRDPDLPRRMEAGEMERSRCIPCNRCVVEMERDGTRCVFADTP